MINGFLSYRIIFTGDDASLAVLAQALADPTGRSKINGVLSELFSNGVKEAGQALGVAVGAVGFALVDDIQPIVPLRPIDVVL